ncbi:MAG: response regulator [Coriobacteriia bacterium]
MGTVLVIDSGGLSSVLAEALEAEEGVEVVAAETTDAARDIVAQAQPHVVVFGPSVGSGEATEFASALAGIAPETASVMVADELDTGLLRAAMRAGMRDVVSADDPVEEVVSAVLLAYEAVQAERIRAGVESETPAVQTASKVVTIFSTKGGVGKSVIATNLGVALARAGKKTVLVDLDLQFGDTGIMLQLRPSRTIFDAMLAYERLDAEMLKGFLTKHSSGLEVLLAPVHPEDAESVTASRVGKVLSLLREIADVVVIDTPGAFTDTVLAALDKSDEVYAVATMDVASIKNTRISLQKLSQLGYDDGRIRIVLNRADSKVWIEADEVESAVESEIVAKIPSDRLVPRSVNKGVPVVSDAPKSPVAKSLVALADVVAEGIEKQDG